MFFWKLPQKNIEVFCCLRADNPEIGFASQDGESFSKEQVKELKTFLQNIVKDLKNVTTPDKPPKNENKGNMWIYYKIKDTKLNDVIHGIKVLLKYEDE